MQAKIKGVKFIDAHPLPGGGGPPRTEFHVDGAWGIVSIDINEDGFVVVTDKDGKHLMVPAARVYRLMT